MRRYSDQVLMSALQPLPPLALIIVAGSSATRLLQSYRSFHELTGWGNPEQHKTAVEAVWEFALGTQLTKSYYEDQSEQLVSLIMPDTDDSWIPLCAYADNALASAAFALRTVANPTAQEALWAARRVYDSLDYYVNQRNPSLDWNASGVEEWIESNPMIQEELERQERDITELKAVKEFNSTIIQQFRHRAECEQVLPDLSDCVENK
jgi:hypothetical protein